MKKSLKSLFLIAICGTLIATTLSGCSMGTKKTAVVTLNYAIWQPSEQAGMNLMARQFEKENPDIKINVELTPWDTYWTKLEAAASGGALPDVFWMHVNNFITYASAGKLMDLTSKIANSKVDSLSNFPKNLVDNFDYKGKNYGMPKDYDTIGLWYNKAIFDKKGVAYPNATWTWSKLQQVAKQLTDPATKTYGFVSDVDTQQVTDDFVFQNGGYIISPDGKKSGYDLPATEAAIQYAVNFGLVDKSSPTQSQFANTSSVQYFESGKVAMGFFGSWNLDDLMSSETVKKDCDVTVLPTGKQKASVANGLGNVIAATTKYPVQAWKFVEWLGSKEANDIQSKSGAAIPAYNGCTQGWIDAFKGYNVKVYPEMLAYGTPYPHSASYATWSQYETTLLTQMFTGGISVSAGCTKLAQEMNASLATEK